MGMKEGAFSPLEPFVAWFLWRIPTVVRIAVGLGGLGLLGLAFREELPRAGRRAAGLGAGIIFAALTVQLVGLLF